MRLALLTLLLAAAPKFVPYTSKADSFRADFPGTPKVEATKDKGMVTRSYVVDNDFAVYTVLVINDAEISVANAKDELDGFREAEKESGKIVAEKAVTLGAAPGLEIKATGKDSDSLSRMYVVKGRSYSVLVDVDHGHTFAEAGVDTFMASFSLGDAAPAPAPAPAGKTVAKEAPLSPDGVEVLGFTADGAKVVTLEHGVYDGKGTPWAKVTFFDTAKGAALGKPLELELETEGATEQDVVVEGKKRAEAERVRLKLPALVPGKRIATDEKGALTAKDGSPVGNLEVKTRRATKKEQAKPCNEPFYAEVVTAKLFVMDGDKPITVLAEKKTPATRACSMGCAASSTWGQGSGALFVVKCGVQGFEGPGSLKLLLPVGKLEYPLEAELPPQ